MKKIFIIAPIVFALSGCDYLDLNGEIEAEKQVKNANAIGSGCRQAGKGIEECYISNPKASKSAVFEGWRTMDEYMRENNVVAQPIKKEAVEEPIKSEISNNKKTKEDLEKTSRLSSTIVDGDKEKKN